MKNITNKVNLAFIEAYTQGDHFSQRVHRYMKLKAKKKYREGYYETLSEAMQSVPSTKLIHSCLKLMELDDLEKHNIINWSKDQIKDYIA